MMHQAQMLFLVTGKCNMACPHCAQGYWRKDYMNYQMTPQEIKTICRRTRELGLHFAQALIMGGEPALWIHLEEGCRIIKESKLFDRIDIYSNCKKTEPLINLLDKGLADKIAVQTVNMSIEGMGELWAKHAADVNIAPLEAHKIHPDKPIENSLPAACGCDQITVFDGKVYSCPGGYHNTVRMGWDVDNPRLWVNIEDDWYSYFMQMDRYSIPACSVCLANCKVWKVAVDSEKQGELK